jgi:GTP-sensing pleiotropic transcriptional regulator CodY
MVDGDGRREYPDAVFIEAIQNSCETTQTIADEIGMTRSGAYRRLQKLREAGRVDSQSVGGTLVWSVTDES